MSFAATLPTYHCGDRGIEPAKLALELSYLQINIFPISKVSSAAYQSLSARDKADRLWSNCLEDKSSAPWLHRLAAIFKVVTQPVCPVFRFKLDSHQSAWHRWSDHQSLDTPPNTQTSSKTPPWALTLNNRMLASFISTIRCSILHPTQRPIHPIQSTTVLHQLLLYYCGTCWDTQPSESL